MLFWANTVVFLAKKLVFEGEKQYFGYTHCYLVQVQLYLHFFSVTTVFAMYTVLCEANQVVCWKKRVAFGGKYSDV